MCSNINSIIIKSKLIIKSKERKIWIMIYELFSVQLCTLTQPLFTIFFIAKKGLYLMEWIVCKKRCLSSTFAFLKPKNWDTYCSRNKKSRTQKQRHLCCQLIDPSVLITAGDFKTLWANTSHSLSGFWARALWVWSSECLKRFKNFCKCAGFFCLKVTPTNDEREWKWDNVSSAC